MSLRWKPRNDIRLPVRHFLVSISEVVAGLVIPALVVGIEPTHVYSTGLPQEDPADDIAVGVAF